MRLMARPNTDKLLFSADVPRVVMPESPSVWGRFGSSFFGRWCLAGVSLLSALGPLPAAHAQAPDPSCDAVSDTEQQRTDGHYREARARLLQCVNAQCGGDVRRRCASALQKLDAVTPSIVIRAIDARGNDVSDVRVSLEETPLASALDGMAIPIDPGEHRLFLERPGHDPVTKTFSIRAGEKFRSIEVQLEPPVLPAVASEPSPAAHGATDPDGRIAAGATLIGVGVVGLAGFTWLGLSARSREHDLESCDPTCSSGAVDSVRKRYLLSNVSLGVGVVALGSATWLLLSGRSEKPAAQSRDNGLFLLGEPGGGMATYRRAF
jgi:hypothetical protein